VSVRAILRVLPLNLSPPQKHILTLLAHHHNPQTRDLVMWPSYLTLCVESGYSDATVKRAIKGLVARGIISRRQRTDNTGASLPPIYKILV